MSFKEKQKHYKTIILSGIFSIFTLVGCDGGSSNNLGALAFLFNSGADYTKVLKYSGTKVILPALENLAADTVVLETKANAYYTTQNTTTLGELQDAWKTARISLKRVEPFYFGPASFPSAKNYYTKLDAFETISARPLWTHVNKVITNTAAPCATTNPVTSTALSQCSVIYKGFEALEMLIFSSGGDANNPGDSTAINTANAPSSRRLEYLKSLAQLIRQDAESLRAIWDPAEGNFLGNFVAGNGSYFTNQGAAFDTYVQSLGNILYQIWDPKLGGPACLTPGCISNSIANPKATEATFSRDAYQGLFDSIEGFEAGYLGNIADTDSHTISKMVEAQNPQLDTDIKAAITALKAAINTSNDLYDQIQNGTTSINNNVKPIYDIATPLKENFNVDAFSVLGVPSLPPTADGD
ncbi:imelysin family protein [Leptospira sarikeiensis]|uniref:Imelysin n=1 Tax=Leptospira sarikeiensis TaxID=2484943 RepID=A0A4R9K7I4_9LEPT|nr:imelysin family protein [Leptospira sarikeiensis]TGL60635.1 imelysin [Leptospira sarikeiensis]